MRLSFLLGVTAAVVERASAIPTPQAPTYGPQGSGGTAAERATAVRDAYIFAWNGYSQYAFPQDQVGPVSHAPQNPLFGWGATLVDGLDTAVIMNIPSIVDQILGQIPKIDFGKSYQDMPVTVFDATIRYLGGLLAAHDLLSGPMSDLATPQDVANLLNQAVNLANNISYAFETPTGIPSNNLYLNNRSTDGATSNSIAQIGTLVLEWTRLSDLTGNQTYAALTEKAESYLLNPTPPSGEPFPGLLGTDVSLTNGTFLDSNGGWIGGGDSYYEYLIKMYVYDSGRFGNYSTAWRTAADSAMNDLASHPSSRSDLTYLAEFIGTVLQDDNEHLGCFDGGNFLLGGMTLNDQSYIDFGLALTEACHNLYVSTKTRIGPETFSWNTTALPMNETMFYQKNGFYITDGGYDLRPEVLESFYYAYRITGDTKYQDWVWDAFTAINATTRTDIGFAQISDVNIAGGGMKIDNEDAFFFAETLKYSYLTFAEPALYDVNFTGVNSFVFNTEGHTLKVAGTPV
ncbi:MAG: maturation of Asn-linked oligosaccharides protein [Chrysothrix sp. TS-e1954]|nr:MAG: maturation of Asn-linked oligosaccharides protein [Chrysothrix sp. TS-e1954]